MATRSELFKPKGEKSEATMLVEFYATLVPDQVVTYAELSGVLGRRFKDNIVPHTRAVERLLKNHGRAMWIEEGVGYRMCRAEEHAGLIAKKREERAMRQIGKAVNAVKNCRRHELTEEQRRRHDLKEIACLEKRMALRRHRELEDQRQMRAELVYRRPKPA